LFISALSTQCVTSFCIGLVYAGLAAQRYFQVERQKKRAPFLGHAHDKQSTLPIANRQREGLFVFTCLACIIPVGCQAFLCVNFATFLHNNVTFSGAKRHTFVLFKKE
jgi:hypothetical protein